jgi:hypothetical protein
MTPNCLQTASLGSESSSNGNRNFSLKRSCDARESRETPNTPGAGAPELAVEVAKVRAFGGAAGGVVPGVEVQHELLAALRGERERRAVGGSELKSGAALPSISSGLKTLLRNSM